MTSNPLFFSARAWGAHWFPMAATALALHMSMAYAQAQTATAPQAAEAMVAARVATATAVEGTAYVTRTDGRQGILARGSVLSVGDVLSTTRNSTVRLRFTDGGETAVRPDSRVVVQAYSYVSEAPESDSLVIGLLKGGLRAITGSIGKRGNVNAYKLNINVATIGIRGTDYTARLCDGDCNATGLTASAMATPIITRSNRVNSSAPVIARLVQLQGPVRVERDSRELDLLQGAPLYASDRVSTTSGGHAVLAFRDDTRITLNSGTQLALTQYAYEPEQAARGSMLFRLVTGGLRVATGLVAKASPSTVKFQTTTATIGIRGTVFDISCGSAGASDDPPSSDLKDARCDESLFASTRNGQISLTGADGGEVLVDAGQSAKVPGTQGAARLLATPPAFFRSLDTPAPEGVEVNLPQLFGSPEPPAGTGGVYLMVREGKVVLEQSGQSLALDAGEAAFAGQSLAPVRLTATPLLLDRDPALSNSAFNFNVCRR